MRRSGNTIGQTVNVAPTGVFLQPLFLNATTLAPEFRNLDADYGMFAAAGTIRHQSTVPGLNPVPTGSWRTIPRDGFETLVLMFADSDAAANETARLRITQWFPVRIPEKQSEDNKKPDMFIPISHVYDLSWGETTNPTLDSNTLSAAAATDFADEVTAVAGGVQDGNDDDLYAPNSASNGVAIGRIRFKTRGAAYITIEVAGATAGAAGTPVGQIQVFYGFE